MTPRSESLRVYWSKSLVKPALIMAVTLAVVLTVFIVRVSNSIQQEALTSASVTLAHVLADPVMLGEELEVRKRVSLVAKNQGLQVSVRDGNDALMLSYPVGEEVTEGKDVLSLPIQNAAGVRIGRILSRNSRRLSVIPVILLSGVLSLMFLFSSAYWLLRSTKAILNDVLAIRFGENVSDSTRDYRFRFDEVREVQEALLSRARQLIQYERQKSRFELARQVAHDIRSPLSAVSVVADVAGGLEFNHRALLRAAVAQIEKISFEILEHGTEIPVCPEPETHTVQNAIALLREVVCIKKLEYCRREGVSIEERLAVRDSNARVRFEPARLMRVLSNLVNNSVEAFCSAGGRVVTEITQSTGEVVVTVEDNGKGMSADIQAAALLPGGSFGKANGHGLGLSNAREVVAGWGGSLTVQSQLGRGTRISIHFPILG